MIIKRNHRHVDMNGFVYLPYLHEWNSSQTLVPLIEVASSVFSIEPPLFTKPATAADPSTTSTTRPTVVQGTPATSHAAVAKPSATAATAVTAYPAVSASSQGTGAYPAVAASSYGGYSAVAAVPSPSHTAAVNPTPASTVTATSSSNTGGGLFSSITRPLQTYYGTPSIIAQQQQQQQQQQQLRSGSPYAYPAVSTATSYTPVNGSAVPAVASNSSTSYPYATVAAVQPSSSSATINGVHSAAANPSYNAAVNSATSSAVINASIAQSLSDKRAKLIQEVTLKLREGLQAKYNSLRDDILREMNTERYLSESKVRLESQQQEIQREIALLQQAVKSLQQKRDKLLPTKAPAPVPAATVEVEKPLAESSSVAVTAAEEEKDGVAPTSPIEATGDAENKSTPVDSSKPAAVTTSAEDVGSATAPVSSVEDSLVPFDDVSVQITKLTAEINAIHDIFYVYERALAQDHNETFNLKVFTKECRELSRQEFLAKALLKKIANQCRQSAFEAGHQQQLQSQYQPQQQLPVSQQQHLPQAYAYPSLSPANGNTNNVAHFPSVPTHAVAIPQQPSQQQPQLQSYAR